MKSNESKSLSFGVGALFPHDSLRVVIYSTRVYLEIKQLRIDCQVPLSSTNLGINVLVAEWAPGSSGSPVVDQYGSLIGFVSAARQ
jgi:hypothetical protein